MSAERAKPKATQPSPDALVQAARRLAQTGDYKLAEGLLRTALTADWSNLAARRWLEFTLEAQGKYNEAYNIHIQKMPIFEN